MPSIELSSMGAAGVSELGGSAGLVEQGAPPEELQDAPGRGDVSTATLEQRALRLPPDGVPQRRSSSTMPSTTAARQRHLLTDDGILALEGSRTPEVMSRAPSPATPSAASRRGILGDGDDREFDEEGSVSQSAGGRVEGRMQSRPAVLPSLVHEVIFVLICGTGQLLFGWLLGNVVVVQRLLAVDLGIHNSQKPWLLGSFLLTNGLSVIISGSLSDHIGSRKLLLGGFAWLSAWNLINGFVLHNKYAFFIARAMQGFSSGALTSSSISLLGQTYSPGRRKSRAFSGMAALAPLGYWLGALHGGVLADHRSWIFWSFSILAFAFLMVAWWIVPASTEHPSLSTYIRPGLKHFDFLGALLAMIGSGCIVAGLTQGSPSNWASYTYVLVIAGVATLGAFALAEKQAHRPLLPNSLWKVPNFTAVIIAYFLSYGAYSAWQFYAIDFWLNLQRVSPLTAALYLTPNAVVGLVCTFLTASLLHLVPGHWVLIASAIASGAGAIFFLPQSLDSSYWAFSMPGVALATLCPDLSFAAVAVLFTTSVPKASQGAAGSFLMTAQSLSSAILVSLADTIGSQTTASRPEVGMVASSNSTLPSQDSELDLQAHRNIWWFSLGVALLGAAITATCVRIPKTQERDHAE
ncbi:MFS general substrate transporter [Ceraceosorus guamensis]|uniref:MFS general substrate transporter n=1 Tax=Ceraceosorus guamensis TaxID=1522189 RepID=A0A316VSH9_9BASI|nr:MFS general substrate transporter [Ceraceosorus guamensis]PWN40008.1 MFS general substrate transporter [Ceraceosorus guamensis]